MSRTGTTSSTGTTSTISSTGTTKGTGTRAAAGLRRLARHRGTALRAGAGAMALIGVTGGVNALGGLGDGQDSRAAAAVIAAPVAGQALSAPDGDAARDTREARDAHRALQLQLIKDKAKAEAARQKAAAAAKAAAAKAAAAKAAAAKAAAARAAAAATARRQAATQQQQEASRSSSRDPRSLARAMLAARGWSGQFGCLDSLWQRESGWNYRAYNPSSGAFGIPQALPGGKMASAGSDWQTNPATQISWGLSYIASTYGSPCSAWAHSQATGWY